MIVVSELSAGCTEQCRLAPTTHLQQCSCASFAGGGCIAREHHVFRGQHKPATGQPSIRVEGNSGVYDVQATLYWGEGHHPVCPSSSRVEGLLRQARIGQGGGACEGGVEAEGRCGRVS